VKKLALLVVITALVSLVSAPASAALYDWDSGVQGWEHETWTDSQAVQSVEQETSIVKAGAGSLQLNMHLLGGNDANYSKGEAKVIRGELETLDLMNQTASVWTYCPTGAGGTNENPNGFQMVFKDSNWKSWYGPWQNVGPANEDQWNQLSVTLGQTTGDFVDTGFDYTSIRQIGIKFGTGTSQSALYSYDGPVYVDEYEVVPEPSSIMLLATGLLGLLGAGFRKRV
jgi:hypothetical protein